MMNKKIEEIVTILKESWDFMDTKALSSIQKLMEEVCLEEREKELDNFANGVEIYRDKELGFILSVFSETEGTYRVPHNHGNGWVIYSVVEGNVEMGNYFYWIKPPHESQLVLKNKMVMQKGDVQIYYPGDVHDTRCVSEKALILRFTSCDLKNEEIEGRMQRFNSAKRCSL